MSRTPLRRAPRVATTFALAVAAIGAACDIPSEAPIFQQTWIVPADSVTVSATEIVPAGVTVTGGATPEFELSTPAINIASTLGAICGQPECQSPVTATVPTPAFTSPAGLLTASIAFPTGVTSATVIDGLVNVQVTNNLGFDPLRPNGQFTAPYGSLDITFTTGALTYTYTVTGSPTQGMPSGATTPLVFLLAAGTYTDGIDVEIAFDVPAGNAATINSANGLAIAASVQGLAVSQATVAVVDEVVDSEPTEFDLEDIDFEDEVVSGALLLETVNPFTATATLTAVIEAPAQGGEGAVTINKAVNIPAQPTSTGTIPLSQAEIRSLLGKQGVTVRVSGQVDGTGPGNTITVTPTSEIIVRTQLQLILNIGA
jgi:hypothetical protein